MRGCLSPPGDTPEPRSLPHARAPPRSFSQPGPAQLCHVGCVPGTLPDTSLVQISPWTPQDGLHASGPQLQRPQAARRPRRAGPQLSRGCAAAGLLPRQSGKGKSRAEAPRGGGLFQDSEDPRPPLSLCDTVPQKRGGVPKISKGIKGKYFLLVLSPHSSVSRNPSLEDRLHPDLPLPAALTQEGKLEAGEGCVGVKRSERRQVCH